MDYSVGSVAALISGNTTPNRPRLTKRALTPMKHPSSPNVTPKSEFLDDRSIFLSPSVQKKKAIVKKSPKRIFENPDLDVTDDTEGSQPLVSPKANKVKKHLKDDLEADIKVNISPKSPKSPKKSKTKLVKSTENEIPKKNLSMTDDDDEKMEAVFQSVNESTPKKKKKLKNLLSVPVEEEKENFTDHNTDADTKTEKNSVSKKKRKSKIFTEDTSPSQPDNIEQQLENEGTPKKKKKKKLESQESDIQEKPSENSVKSENQLKSNKKRNKNKNKNKLLNIATAVIENQVTESSIKKPPKKKNKVKNIVNPNAITNKDSDSEHESDNEIESENEETNKQILKTEPAESSDDDEEEKGVKKSQKQETKVKKQENSEDEVKRTLFVGNVPFSKKCKKEVKKLFGKYGEIETVRIRTIPVKDARVTPKLAVIKNELHPERTTVNVYIKFQHPSSVDKALAENNTVLNDYHLRVTRSDTTGAEHDPNKAVFVGNLPFAMEDDTLRAKFENCGEIESVRIIRDSKTNAGKGFGYVNFASKDGVELALAMSEEDLTIKNRIIRVKRCNVTNKKIGANQNKGKFQGSSQRFQGSSQKFQESSQKFQGRDRSFRNNDDVGRNQGKFGRNEGNQSQFGRSQGNRMRSQGNFGNVDKTQGQDGAHRRILKKRQSEEGGDGPPNKRANINQPAKEKKPRKEFVGMTAEKKKKQKFDKGQKKKRALSEILTKYNDK